MSIKKSRDVWKGTEPGDLREYLEDYTADSYPIGEFRIAACPCGSRVFTVDADDTEGAARRTCSACAREHFMCDSAEYWEEAEPERCACPCGNEDMNVGVGFALYPEDNEVKWLYIGCRCTKCGLLGNYADWKIAYSPSRHLFESL